ncbi:glutamine amidotransferase [Thermobispora bispora]|uniref:Lipid II isoglutaminyl synthase (glutamine-hydrolyzing) subunit GatD n=1 Tax=Thermobispora bispora (strain ATCC 19993 / DSM 43833 / CBS 139.67 / JCM 10125 / KCTC 9307 / NBRC 14880 / R51) TaxID=469371 RepID=D6Y4E3_THEBD|nr:glutamine amidotransferase [Thermobispora bispora]MBO2475690.1 glutamine amidotransferase [Actinomycetales bacterium]MDI9581214.1 glutamine amidotransferase [Thermobispora sp.]ADG87197.1 CobB/CobQ domain protein glutamine amidotransferase [Thermobispora bispora DSM 43833]MBX6167534.1 glutamine amidotransferase [Thermobispora bispora]QSI47158.1 glutamine amidotransferase [Thermobispora bispora]
MQSDLCLVWIYPDLLSTYGDQGNVLVLEHRARARGIPARTIHVRSSDPVPQQGHIYLIGGGEDRPQILATERLRRDGGLHAAVANGAVVFAVCAGYQLIGRVYAGDEGQPVEGVGLLDISSGRGQRRAVGELAAEPDPALGLPTLTGFENHMGVTTLGPGVRPLARTVAGVGNGDGTEGCYAGRVVGTYMHGPALARNPALADLLLSWVVGALPPMDDTWYERLRQERLAAVLSK